MSMQVLSLALLSGLKIRRCCELWCRSQMQLRSGVAVAVWSYCGWSCYSRQAAVAPIRPLAREPPYAAGAALKSKNKQIHCDIQKYWHHCKEENKNNHGCILIWTGIDRNKRWQKFEKVKHCKASQWAPDGSVGPPENTSQRLHSVPPGRRPLKISAPKRHFSVHVSD